MAVGRGSIMRAAKAGSKKEKSIEFMTQATESQVEEKGMAEEKQDVKETAVAPADDQGTKETAAEAKPAVNSETTSETAAAEKPVKKTTRRRTAAKAVPAKKKAAETAKKETAETAKKEAAEVSKKDVAAEAETSKKDSAAEADQAVEKEVPVKKTADKTTTKAAPGKKAAAKTKAPARAKKETKEIIKEAVETVAAEPVKSESKNYVGIKDKMPTYLL